MRLQLGSGAQSYDRREKNRKYGCLELEYWRWAVKTGWRPRVEESALRLAGSVGIQDSRCGESCDKKRDDNPGEVGKTPQDRARRQCHHDGDDQRTDEPANGIAVEVRGTLTALGNDAEREVQAGGQGEKAYAFAGERERLEL